MCVGSAPTSSALTFLRKLMKRYPRPDAIIADRLRSYRAALRELGGSDASRISPPSILPSTTTSTSDDPSVHGTISNSTAPLHSPSGVISGRPNSLVLGGITQTCDFTLTVPQYCWSGWRAGLCWFHGHALFYNLEACLTCFSADKGLVEQTGDGSARSSFLGHSTVTPASTARLWVPVLDRRTPWLYQPRVPSLD